ncbi:hypothetical protein [Serinicoccus chungangensis]|uniref:hypothetical protein n=1 Tax=Serinicoccus chungangensis TaxID=767452 RepID=UPI001118C57A|nr:hypothetical protein [Serinicoccus chungangensis]
MVQHHGDEALHRLQASDPATGSHPDLHRLRSLVAHKAPASQGAERASRVDDDLLRGPAIRAPWVAAACIAALAIGAGGYALGTQRGSGTLLVAGGDSLLAPAGAGIDAGLSAELSGESFSSGGTTVADGAAQPYDPGPVRLVPGPGLSSERTTAPVRVLRSDEDPEAFVEAWARTLGLQGAPLPTDVDFLPEDNVGVAEADTGRMIMASSEDGALHIIYTDVFSSPDCRETLELGYAEEREMLEEFWQGTFGADTPLPTAQDCREVGGERPSDEQAVGAAQDFLTLAGVPTDGYDFQVQDYADEGSSTVYVEAAPEGGAYGPRHINVTVGPAGVVDAYAGLGEMVSLGDYPVISPVEAVQRYGLREFSMEYGVQLPEDLEEAVPGEEGLTFVEPQIPDSPEVTDGMDLPLLLKDKEVTGATLVQGTIYTQSGSMEVPTWELTTDDGMSYPVMAVADEAIDWVAWE